MSLALTFVANALLGVFYIGVLLVLLWAGGQLVRELRAAHGRWSVSRRDRLGVDAFDRARRSTTPDDAIEDLSWLDRADGLPRQHTRRPR